MTFPVTLEKESKTDFFLTLSPPLSLICHPAPKPSKDAERIITMVALTCGCKPASVPSPTLDSRFFLLHFLSEPPGHPQVFHTSNPSRSSTWILQYRHLPSNSFIHSSPSNRTNRRQSHRHRHRID
jgi:hypothetical protein